MARHRARRRGKRALALGVAIVVVAAGVTVGFTLRKHDRPSPLAEALASLEPTPAPTAEIIRPSAPAATPKVSPLVIPLNGLAGPNAGVLYYPLVSFGAPTYTGTPGPLPARSRTAYRNAVANMSLFGCHLQWQILAGIGEVLTGSARRWGSMAPDWNGRANPPLYGPVLDGRHGGRFVDTDHGTLDNSRDWDRIVGPMAFLPQAWRAWGTDANSDGVANPQEIDDAALSAARFLCDVQPRLDNPASLHKALEKYNSAADFPDLVIRDAATYQ